MLVLSLNLWFFFRNWDSTGSGAALYYTFTNINLHEANTKCYVLDVQFTLRMVLWSLERLCSVFHHLTLPLHSICDVIEKHPVVQHIRPIYLCYDVTFTSLLPVETDRHFYRYDLIAYFAFYDTRISCAVHLLILFGAAHLLETYIQCILPPWDS